MLPVISKKQFALVLAKDVPKYFSREEIRSILERCNSERDHLLINFLWRTGARVSEALACRVTDIDKFNKTVKLVSLKRKKKYARFIPLHDDILRELGFYLLDTNKTGEKKYRGKISDHKGKIFPFKRAQGYNIVKKAVLSAGFDRERAHPHIFRHSFAINLIRQYVPITTIQELLGHASIFTTLIYTKVMAKDYREFIDRVEF